MGNLIEVWRERARASLFVIPMAFVVAGALLGLVGVAIDERLGDVDLPFTVSTTVDAARAVLGTVAGATITVAGIAFSVALLIFQLASSQYSPRIIHGLFRDPYNKRAMGIVVGTFTYCLVVLRSVRGPLEDGGASVVPVLSVNVAVLLGILAILTIVGFIDHAAHQMDISEVLQGVTRDTRACLRDQWARPDRAPAAPPPPPELDTPGHRIGLDGDGWIQRIDRAALQGLVPPGGRVRLETTVGRYAVAGTPLCTIWPVPADADDARHIEARARRAVALGDARTLTGDVAYGVRQLADVALKALSPGINDPTTAQDALFHTSAVLREAFSLVPPPRVRVDHDGRCLHEPEATDHADLVALAFAEVRRDAAAHPAVCAYLLEAMHLVHTADGGEGPTAGREELVRQARLLVAEAQRAVSLDADRELVRASFEHRFGGAAGPG